MRVRAVTLLWVLVLCVSAAEAVAQTSATYPDAPHLLTASLGEFAPPPVDLSSGTFSLSSGLPVRPVAALMVAAPTVPPVMQPKVMDKKFIALGALVFGLTTMDMEFTQHCLHRHTCVELNPTLPHSRFGMYAVNTPINLGVMYFSYRRRAAGKWGWWVAPMVDIGSHTVGVGSNIRFLGK
jgi:hypothetical protein